MGRIGKKEGRKKRIISSLSSSKKYIRQLSKELGIPYVSCHGLVYELEKEGKINLRPVGENVIIMCSISA